MMNMTFVKRSIKAITIFLSILAILCVWVGVRQSLHSSLFLLKKVEVVHVNSSPLFHSSTDDQAILKAAAIPVGKVSLFDLDLTFIERQLIAQEWVQEFKIQKKFPDTLVLIVTTREPKAIFQSSKGNLAYVDNRGKIFGSVSLVGPNDLPLLVGFSSAAKIQEALQLVDRWESSELIHLSWISSVVWDSGKGYRMLVGYPIGSKGAQLSTTARTMVDIGQNIDESLNGKIFRLANVIRYLSGKAIASRQIWADAGKKIVVKTIPGS